jgi:hypothetical protein
MPSRTKEKAFLTFTALAIGCGSSGGGNQSNLDGGSRDATVDGNGTDGSQKTDASDASTHDAGADTHTSEASSEAGIGTSVVQFHNNASRDGHYVDTSMNPTAAGGLKLDSTFGTSGVPITGPLWGQPLYVENGVSGKGTFYVADDSNDLYAIDEATGAIVWSKPSFVMAAGATGACGGGDPSPVGVTGTPVIDLSSRTMFFVAAEGTGSAITTQKIHAVSIDTGDELTSPAGWPIDVTTAVKDGTITFSPKPQGERAALSLVNGTLYVPFGGENGDCCNGSDTCSTKDGNGTYHGWVVSVPIATPTAVTAFATPSPGAGIWGVGGIAADSTTNDVFAVTSNGYGQASSTWAEVGSEAVIRFNGGSTFSGATKDFFAPSTWQSMDARDADLGGTGSLVIDVPGATPSELVVALGKTGVMYLLDRTNLGGIGTGNGTTGEGVYSDKVSTGQMRTSAAAYATGGATYVVFDGGGGTGSCTLTGKSGNLIAVKITAGSPPTFAVAWCASTGSVGAIGGSPIVTTTDATGTNPIVWVVGTQGTNQLTGWDGVSGVQVFDGGGVTMDEVRHYSTLIDVNGRLIVGSTDKLYAFTTK